MKQAISSVMFIALAFCAVASETNVIDFSDFPADKYALGTNRFIFVDAFCRKYNCNIAGIESCGKCGNLASFANWKSGSGKILFVLIGSKRWECKNYLVYESDGRLASSGDSFGDSPEFKSVLALMQEKWALDHNVSVQDAIDGYKTFLSGRTCRNSSILSERMKFENRQFAIREKTDAERRMLQTKGDELIDAMLKERFGVEFGMSITNFTSDAGVDKVELTVKEPYKYLDFAEGHFTNGKLTSVFFGTVHDGKIAIEPWEKSVMACIDEFRRTLSPATNMNVRQAWKYSNYTVDVTDDSWYKARHLGLSIRDGKLKEEIAREIRNRGGAMPDADTYRKRRKERK